MRQEGTQLAASAGLLKAGLQPLGGDARPEGERVAAVDPGLSVLACEETDVVLDLSDGDVGYDLRHCRVELKGGKYVAHARDGGLWNGQDWPWGEHVDAPCGWKYE